MLSAALAGELLSQRCRTGGILALPVEAIDLHTNSHSMLSQIQRSGPSSLKSSSSEEASGCFWPLPNAYSQLMKRWTSVQCCREPQGRPHGGELHGGEVLIS